ncbi:MAG: DNA-binding response regulator, partial [Spirochaetaceae bacterium]
MTELTILLVDDHQVFREGVAELLAKENCCGRMIQTHAPDEARRVIAQELPDVVVTDMSFPEGSGLDLIAWMQEAHPDTPCLCLSMHADADTLREAIAAGARGYVTKSSGYAELVHGVERVAAGGHYLDQ